MVKSFKKNPSSLEPIDQLPLNLVCSIGVLGPIVVNSNYDWLDLDPILYGKKWTLLIFLKLLLPVNFNFVYVFAIY